MYTVVRPVRELAGVLVSPFAIALLLVAVGLIAGLLGRARVRRWLFIGAVIVGYLGSTSLVGSMLLAPLEDAYPPLELRWLPAVAYVVVLGSGYRPRDHIPVTAALDPDGLARIVEGIRIARRLNSAHLIVSGGAPPDDAPPALGYAALADSLGVSSGSITVSAQGLDTTEEARAIAKLVGRAPFILVTSAYHMPRAMRLMRLADTNPIAAPTNQRALGDREWGAQLLPSAGGLERTQRALHEYLGLAALAAGFD